MTIPGDREKTPSSWIVGDPETEESSQAGTSISELPVIRIL